MHVLLHIPNEESNQSSRSTSQLVTAHSLFHVFYFKEQLSAFSLSFILYCELSHKNANHDIPAKCDYTSRMLRGEFI